MSYVMVCSSSSCDFQVKNSTKDGIERYCTKCGSENFWKCPHCGRPFRRVETLFCFDCGKHIKSLPEKEGL